MTENDEQPAELFVYASADVRQVRVSSPMLYKFEVYAEAKAKVELYVSLDVLLGETENSLIGRDLSEVIGKEELDEVLERLKLKAESIARDKIRKMTL